MKLQGAHLADVTVCDDALQFASGAQPPAVHLQDDVTRAQAGGLSRRSVRDLGAQWKCVVGLSFSTRVRQLGVIWLLIEPFRSYSTKERIGRPILAFCLLMDGRRGFGT